MASRQARRPARHKPRGPDGRREAQSERNPKRAVRITHDLNNVLFLAQFSNKEKVAPDAQLPVRLAGVVRKGLPLLRRACGPRVSIRIESLDPRVHVRASPDAIKQMLLNLVLNADQAMPRGGKIEIRTTRARRAQPGPSQNREEAVIEVADTGPGVPDGSRSEIFRPFYTTKPGTKGLGLTAVQRIAERAGGRVELVSTDKGACFRISLPCQ